MSFVGMDPSMCQFLPEGKMRKELSYFSIEIVHDNLGFNLSANGASWINILFHWLRGSFKDLCNNLSSLLY